MNFVQRKSWQRALGLPFLFIAEFTSCSQGRYIWWNFPLGFALVSGIWRYCILLHILEVPNVLEKAHLGPFLFTIKFRSNHNREPNDFGTLCCHRSLSHEVISTYRFGGEGSRVFTQKTMEIWQIELHNQMLNEAKVFSYLQRRPFFFWGGGGRGMFQLNTLGLIGSMGLVDLPMLGWLLWEMKANIPWMHRCMRKFYL